ncbi:MAG: fumarate hydratase [Candidatus Omnitrophota bacterium]
MRTIDAKTITNAVAQLSIRANTHLRSDVTQALRLALAQESNTRTKKMIRAILENAACARKNKLALCQDTGLAYVFAELGQGVVIRGGDFTAAIQRGIAQGYQRGSLRNSVIAHPLKRNSGSDFQPGVVHLEMVKGSHLKLTVFPKGFGSENKSQAKMFKPTAGITEIKQFILEAVRNAGAAACPPFVVGVGIGGGFDYAAFLAKKALLRNVTGHTLTGTGRSQVTGRIYKLEKELLREINRLNIGPMGLGGKTTALAVNIETYPTHIAGLPVAVNISCHALRSATARL